MNELLNENFTMILKKANNHRFAGYYFKATKNGMVKKMLCGDEIVYICNYFNILDRLNDDSYLQVYKSLNEYCSMIVNVEDAELHFEKKDFDIIYFVEADSLIGSLNDLNNKLDNEKELVPQKTLHASNKPKLND